LEENSADTCYNKFLNLIRLGRIDEAKIFARRGLIFLSLLVHHVLKPQKTVFRPKEIKKQLALKGENISDSTLSRVNKSLVALGISQKTGKKPRGRPIDRYDLFNLSGPDVMYGDSDLVKALQKIVSNRKIRNLLYSSLIESKFGKMVVLSFSFFNLLFEI
jgi:hypothetical protein